MLMGKRFQKEQILGFGFVIRSHGNLQLELDRANSTFTLGIWVDARLGLLEHILDI